MRKGYTVFAALFGAALVATPLVMSAGKALATAEDAGTVAAPIAVGRVVTAPVAAPVADPETCTRKVRVVYSGYAAAPTACR